MHVCVAGEAVPPLEPQQAEHAANAHVLFKDVCDGDPRIQQLLASLITDTRHERRRFTDQAQLLE